MIDVGKIKVGTVIVERGKIFKIFKVKEEKFNGEGQKVMYYKPYFDDPTQNGLICSIPVISVNEANIRIPSNVSEIKKVIKDLKCRVRLRNALEVNDAKLVINENDITETVFVIKKFWAERKKRETGKLPKSKEDMLESAIDQVAEEIAYVTQISLERAYEKIHFALGS
jgi:RNA polymerase-interacting CarD/CdnL/TRCF family regulator